MRHWLDRNEAIVRVCVWCSAGRGLTVMEVTGDTDETPLIAIRMWSENLESSFYFHVKGADCNGHPHWHIDNINRELDRVANQVLLSVRRHQHVSA